MDESELEQARTASHASDFLGLSVEDARDLAAQLGFAFRTYSDDNPWLTADWHPRQITAHVRDGAVVNADAR